MTKWSIFRPQTKRRKHIMKKRTAVLVLTMALSLSIVGCGNSAETKQEETQTAQKESDVEIEQEEPKSDIDAGDFVFYAEIGEAKYIIRESNFIPTDEEIQFTTIRDTDIWNIDGKNVGYIKSGTTISINEHGEDIAFYRIKNPIENTDYEYLFIDVEDYVSQKPEEEQQVETPVLSEEYIEEQRMYEEAISLIDENKTYTFEEFHALMGEIADVLGVEYSDDVANQNKGSDIRMNMNGKEMKRIFEEEQLIYFIMYSNSGNNSLDFFISINPSELDGEITAKIFARPHRE